jgi:hypothetical protein
MRAASVIAAIAFLANWSIAAQEIKRVEISRADLTGAPGMEVINSITEVPPNTVFPRHFHHGIESVYVIEGGMIQIPGREQPVSLATGTSSMNLRDVPHAGFKVVGDKTLKLFTVHIVDKGKPLYVEVK